MGSSYLTNPVVFVVETVFSLYILAVMLRILLQWFNADYYNPVSQFLVKVTHPPLRYLRRVIPPVGKVDTSAIILLVGLQMLSSFLVIFFSGQSLSIFGIFFLSLAELCSLLINIFVFAIIIRAVLSWFAAGNYNPATSVLYSLTDPLLIMGQRVIPVFSGIDLSPIFILLALQVLKMLLLPPLYQAARLFG